MPTLEINGTPTYQGDMMLLRWGDNSTTGMTVTLVLNGIEEGHLHPFKGLGTGKQGQKFVAVLVPVDDEGQALGKIIDVVPEKPKRRWHEMSRAQRAGMLCADSKFLIWISEAPENRAAWKTTCLASKEHSAVDVAAEMIRSLCGVQSRSEFDTDEEAGNRWDDLEAEYRKTLPVDESRLPERTW